MPVPTTTGSPPPLLGIDDPGKVSFLRSRLFVGELFTSLDCLFCPEAENMVSDLVRESHGVLIACYVDPENASYPMAREFCAARQERYSATLSDGLMYTPQFVLNGHVDSVGHQRSDVVSGIGEILEDTVLPITIRSSSEPGVFLIGLPDVTLPKDMTADIFMMTYRPPYTVPKNLRQSAIRPRPLLHVAHRFSPMGSYSGKAKSMTLSFVPGPDDAGFVVFVQRSDNQIIAAGMYPDK